jgi:nucleoid-associated protein YgaU
MERKLKSILKTLKINESLISTIMGGVVVVVMAAMIFNYFKSFNKNGKISDESAANVVEEQVSKDLPTTYKVVKGDDLWHISEKFYNSGYNFVDIAKANKLGTGNVIEVGMVLTIPKVEQRLLKSVKVEAEVTPAAKTEAKTEVKSKTISIEGTTYKTTKGDHLWSIALRAYGDGYAWSKIYNANKKLIGNNPSRLFTGIELTLPR